jgi:hypothetical protein
MKEQGKKKACPMAVVVDGVAEGRGGRKKNPAKVDSQNRCSYNNRAAHLKEIAAECFKERLGF